MLERFGTQSSKWDVLPRDSGLPYIALSVADMDFACSAAVIAAVERRASLGLYGYTDLPAEHSELVADWLGRKHGWSVPPEYVVYAHRIVQVLPLLLRTLTEPGDGIVLFVPSYGPLERAIVANGRRTIRIPLEWNGRRFCLDRVRTDQALRTAQGLLLVNPHNPVGTVWSEEDLAWLAEAVARHQVAAFSDDIHASFVHDGFQHRFLGEFPGAERVFTFTSPSKAFNVPGLEITHVVIADEQLRAVLRDELFAAGFHNPSFFAHDVTQAAYGHSDQWFTATWGTICRNLGTLRNVISEMPGLRLIDPEGTYMAWVDATGYEGGESQLRQWWIDRAHVVPSFGSDFGHEFEGFVRVNLATPESQFQEAMARLRATK